MRTIYSVKKYNTSIKDLSKRLEAPSLCDTKCDTNILDRVDNSPTGNNCLRSCTASTVAITAILAPNALVDIDASGTVLIRGTAFTAGVLAKSRCQ